jgi:TldD protein
MTSPTSPSHKRYFFDKFGITERLLERCLGEALAAGGDYADLYFESVTATALGVDEQIVKSASQGTSAGCGIRVLSGERTGYAYTDNLSPDRLLHAARTAALIASGPATQTVQGFTEAPAADLYPVPLGGFDLDLAARLELILRADRAARAFSTRIVQVRAAILRNSAASSSPPLTAPSPATPSPSAASTSSSSPSREPSPPRAPPAAAAAPASINSRLQEP